MATELPAAIFLNTCVVIRAQTQASLIHRSIATRSFLLRRASKSIYTRAEDVYGNKPIMRARLIIVETTR